MAIQVQGNGGVVADVGGTGFRAVKIQQMPVEYGALGSYRKSLLSGTMAAGLGADSEVFQFRWTNATNLCLIRSVFCDGLVGSATAFTAGFGNLKLIPARSWTADGSGGTAGTISGNNGKLRTSMGTNLIGAVRIASTGALTAGTKTLDTNPIGQLSLTFGTVASVIYTGKVTLFGEDISANHPLILAQNEGFVITAVVPATGTWQVGFTVDWVEVASY